MARKPTTDENGSAPAADTPAPAANGPAPTHQPLVIQGLTFQSPLRYTEGHPLSTVEAAALNGLLAENLRNNFSKRIQDARAEAVKSRGEGATLTDAEVGGLSAAFDAYAGEYVFQGRSSPRAQVDPITREALRLAIVAVKGQLEKLGHKIKDLEDGTVEELASRLIEQDPRFRTAAENRLNEAKALASVTMDLGIPAPAPSPTA
jgi:hypothetical protein